MLIEDAEDVGDAEHERLMAKAGADGIKPNFELPTNRSHSCPLGTKFSTATGCSSWLRPSPSK